jgi:peptidylprolyl isomerase
MAMAGAPPSKVPCLPSDKDVYFDISINGADAGRIVFVLCDKQAPNASKRFREMATRNDYGNINFLFARKNQLIQGSSVEALYKYRHLIKSEGIEKPLKKPGMLSLIIPSRKYREDPSYKEASFAFNFLIQTNQNFKPDRDLITFGYVRTGFSVIKVIENIDTLDGNTLSKSVVVTESGLIGDLALE